MTSVLFMDTIDGWLTKTITHIDHGSAFKLVYGIQQLSCSNCAMNGIDIREYRVSPTHPCCTKVDTRFQLQDPLLVWQTITCHTRPHLSDQHDLIDTICLCVWFIANKSFWLISQCNEVVLTLVNKWKDISALYHQTGSNNISENKHYHWAMSEM